MINAVGSTYGAGNVDPGYDTAANLKTNLTDAGKSFGKLAGQYYSEDVRKERLEKRAKKAESKGGAKAAKFRDRSKRLYGEEKEKTPPVENAEFILKDRKGINAPTESNPVVDEIMSRTQPFSSLNTPEDADFKPKDGYSFAKNIFKSLNGGTEFSESPIEMKGDGFNKGMLRKNKYKK
jgi:hypothetical protein